MTRPTLVIGLGGTGQWVLTYLKKELLEIGNGKIPDKVRLLGIDTAKGDFGIGGGAGKDKKGEKTQLGDVKLTDNIEFVQIGSDLYPLVQGIDAEIKNTQLSDRQRQYKHLYWYPANEYLKKLPSPAFNTIYGAGALRAMGRLSLFTKITDVRNMIQKKISEIAGFVEYEVDQKRYNSLEVLIVGSLAGGTGAGTFIDVAYLVKQIVRNLNIAKTQVRGFIVMPSAFHGMALSADPDKLDRSFAAWTELDAFMLTNVQNANPGSIVYSPVNNISVVCDQPPFDQTYLVDANRTTLPLQPPPEEGLFPAIAQSMMFIIDEKSGPFFSEDLINTIASRRAGLPAGVLHSAIGTFTIKVPAFFEQSKAARALGNKALGAWLQPVIDKDGLVSGVGGQIQEKLPDGGLLAAQDFLSAGGQADLAGNQYNNTLFFPKVATVHATYHAQTMKDLVNQTARGALSNEKSTWMNALITTAGISDDDKKLAQEIRDEMFTPVWKEFPPSAEKKDTPQAAITRLTNGTENLILTKYGKEDTQGKRLGGSVRQTLNRAKDYQLRRFRILIHIWLLRVLTGTDPDPVKAKAGKLGYVQQTLQEIECAFASYEAFNKQVQTQRDSDNVVAKANAASKAAEQRYRQLASKSCPFTFFDNNVHPDAHQAQRNYLKAQQLRCETLRDEDFLIINIQTAIECKKFAEKTRAEVQKWVEVLATGREGVDGLYKKLTGSLKGLEDNLGLDKRLGNPDFEKTQSFTKVMQLVGNLSDLPVTDEQVRDVMSRIVWQVSDTPEGIGLKCSVRKFPEKEGEAEIVVPLVTALADKLETDQTGGEYNLSQLIDVTEPPFVTVAHNNKIVDELKKIAPNGAMLAQKLLGVAEPFYAIDNMAVHPADHSAFIQVDDAQDPNYLDQFQKQIQSLTAAQNIRINLAGSEDPFRFTYVRCDDLMPSESFQIRATLKTEYDRLLSEKKQTYKEKQIFPTLQNALHYELKIPELLQESTSKFHPELVGLLENTWHFDLWFFAVTAGFIKEKRDAVGHSTWTYQLKGSNEILLYQTPVNEGVAGTNFNNDYMSAMRGFLSGKDYRADRKGVVAYEINWEDINRAFLEWEAKNVTETKKLYAQEVSGQGPAVKKILDESGRAPAYEKEKFTQLSKAGRVVFADRLKKLQG